MCHGMGEQRRDNNDRGRMKDHRPALLPNQPSTMVPFNPWNSLNILSGKYGKVHSKSSVFTKVEYIFQCAPFALSGHC